METTLSPIEQAFWDAAQSRIKGLESQQWIGQYRVDFVVQQKRLIIELDGHEFHSSREQRTSDAARQRELQRLEYTVIRFTGTEIHADVDACVEETIDLLSSLPERDELRPPRERVRYCIRMKEVITHLLDKFGIDVHDRYYHLELSLGRNWDNLVIERQDKLITVAHFYIPKEDVKMPDPLVGFVPYKRIEGYEDWAPILLRQLFPRRLFCRVNDDDKVVVLDFDAQHEAAHFAENWAQVIRQQGWLSNATKIG